MKHIKLATLSLLMLASLSAFHSAYALEPSGPESDAGAVVLRYFDAHIQGDTATIRALISGDLLEKRARLIGNPAYSGHLIDTYGQARIEITGYSTLDDGSISVEARVFMSPDETLNKRFLLKRGSGGTGATPSGFLIYGEMPVM